MERDLFKVDFQNIEVKSGEIRFNEYESLKEQALQLARNIEQVEVSDENIQTSKKMIAAVNKRVKEMEDKRIAIKKEILSPYETFERQVKEIIGIVKDADAIVRNQIRELEEIEREEKRNVIQDIYDKRIQQYSFGETFHFDDFLKPNHLNKSVSIKSVESEMVQWLEKLDADLQVINTLPNSEAILIEYYDTKDLTVAIRIVNEREALKNQISQLVKPSEKTKENVYVITLFDEKDATTLEMFMELKNIKYTIEKVEK